MTTITKPNKDRYIGASGIRKLNLDFHWLPMQDTVFVKDTHKYVMLAKGRRAGGTYGAALYALCQMAHGKAGLWVDTVQANLKSYYERYFYPWLAEMPRYNNHLPIYKWNSQEKHLKFLKGFLDMRSAERPQNLEGFAYDFVICNEAGLIFQKGSSLWYNTIYPMTIDKNARVFFVGTPKGKLDKTGKEHLFWTFWKKGMEGQDPDWKSFCFTTYDNPKLHPADIKTVEENTPALIKEQELYAKFVDVNLDSVFRDSWWHITESVPEKIHQKILSWDTAFKEGDSADYSVCTCWVKTDREFICIDMYKDKLTFPDLITKTKLLYEKHMPDVVLVEDKASGQSLIQMFQQTTLPVLPFRVDRDKLSRAVAITPLIESGKVGLLKSDWTDDLINECSMFPNGEYDDIVDSVSQALLYLSKGMAIERDIRPVISRKISVSPEASHDLGSSYRKKSNVLSGYWG